VSDPESGRCFLTQGSGMGMKSGFGIRIRVPDHIYESLETMFWVKILKFLERIRDLGWKKFGFENRGGMEKIRSGINIPDPQHWYHGYRFCHHAKGLFSHFSLKFLFFRIRIRGFPKTCGSCSGSGLGSRSGTLVIHWSSAYSFQVMLLFQIQIS
jgi:hypothetical protein